MRVSCKSGSISNFKKVYQSGYRLYVLLMTPRVVQQVHCKSYEKRFIRVALRVLNYFVKYHFYIKLKDLKSNS